MGSRRGGLKFRDWGLGSRDQPIERERERETYMYIYIYIYIYMLLSIPSLKDVFYVHAEDQEC